MCIRHIFPALFDKNTLLPKTFPSPCALPATLRKPVHGGFGCLLGLVGYTRDASLDGLKVAQVTALERRDGVLVWDHLKVVIELVNEWHTWTFSALTEGRQQSNHSVT